MRHLDISDQIGPAVSVTDARELQLADLIFRTPGDDPVFVENVQGLRCDLQEIDQSARRATRNCPA